MTIGLTVSLSFYPVYSTVVRPIFQNVQISLKVFLFLLLLISPSCTFLFKTLKRFSVLTVFNNLGNNILLSYSLRFSFNILVGLIYLFSGRFVLTHMTVD